MLTGRIAKVFLMPPQVCLKPPSFDGCASEQRRCGEIYLLTRRTSRTVSQRALNANANQSDQPLDVMRENQVDARHVLHTGN